ncbi:MAG: DUF1552 domain-containing protein [Deltaproteobacteria bacterium]|nr:DUF1552 domain-containing protein [Deltaproteobacteria bacterium]
MSLQRNGRRSFLRGALATGVGVSVGLPTLESLVRPSSRARADAPIAPRRYLTWFWGNGIVQSDWVPSATGTSWTAPRMLAQLATPSLRPYVSVVTNAELRTFWQPHSGGASGILTGSGLLHADDGARTTPAGASIDQAIAAAIEPAPGGLRSLELGVANHSSGLDGSVYNYISHRGPDMPNAYDRDPRSVFRRLFGMTTTPASDPFDTFRGSVLDAVLADTTSLSRDLTAADRARLDQHLTSVRELELRVGATGPMCTPPSDPSSRVDDLMISDEHGPARNLTLLNDLMSELLALAMACDLTRVASYMYTGPAAFTRYWEVSEVPLEDIGGVGAGNPWGMPAATHGMAHGGTETSEGFATALRESMRHFARTLEILRTTPDGEGNLLDHLAILGTSCTSDGPSHTHDEYPIVVAGLAGGALRGGLHHRFAAPENASRVPLTLARAVGAELASFGLDEGLATDSVSELLT